MILLLSEERDISTDSVIEWLHYYEVSFRRINTTEINAIREVRIDDTGTSILFEDDQISFSTIKSVWFRRGAFRFVSDYFLYSKKSNEVNAQVARQLSNDASVLSSYIYEALSEKVYLINHPYKYNLNKLIVLNIARNCGLKIPRTIVTKLKDNVQNYQNEIKQPLITKQISDNFQIKDNQSLYSVGTRWSKTIPDSFFYSLFQERVDRLCELRIFYLNDQFFPAAIFVDDDLQDARALKLGSSRARITPFVLPEEILYSLKSLTSKVNVNCGSIDMILDKRGQYYFLEINPVGQYDYIEIACNYSISKLIAETLCKQENNTFPS